LSHRQCLEWGRIAIGPSAGATGFARGQADALLAAARRHALGGAEGADILSEVNGTLRTRQVVGLLAAGGASLEILPKVDPDAADGFSGAEDLPTVRSRLVHMLDVALGLDLGTGPGAAIARQGETLLDVLVRLFADQLLNEVRKGLPRLYLQREDDLPALRGRLDAVRQFTVHAVRPDRLACRFDSLESDIPLMQVMKACVTLLARHARGFDTLRRLQELRLVLADVADIAPARLPWDRVRIDRSNRRWQSLFALARLFLARQWQATHHAAAAPEGVTLLFPMNVLFESYVAARLRRALAGSAIEVVAQGGLLHCLGDWQEGAPCTGAWFQTKPDLILRDRTGRTRAIIDTKWKKPGEAGDARLGVSQGDVYQMMAYARLYRCHRLTLLYPARPGQGSTVLRRFGMGGGHERLNVAALDLADGEGLETFLQALAVGEFGQEAGFGARAAI
jgi:5-methylcytosine-specific restriction enzyme subunit McrC